MIEVKNISKKFGDTHVLKNVSCYFEKGKTNLIIGESGAGKTTLIKILVGLHKEYQGTVPRTRYPYGVSITVQQN